MAKINFNLGNLKDILASLKGATPITFISETEPSLKCPKSNPLAGRLRKRSTVNGFIGFDYANSVNNQLKREGKTADFEAHPRKWGQRIAGTPLVEHKGNYYLEVKVQRVLDTQYILDGKVVDKAVIAEHLPTPKDETGRQGVDNAVIMRDYKLETLQNLRVGGKEILITHIR